MTEEWRKIPGLPERYEVSNLGNVRASAWTGPDGKGGTRAHVARPVPLRVNKRGYTVATLYLDQGKARPKPLHRLMATAFLPNPDGLPLVRHLNDVRTDNRLENLAWGTYGDNIADCVRNGKNVNASKTRCPKGHEYRVRNGRRRCTTCELIPTPCPVCGVTYAKNNILRHKKQHHPVTIHPNGSTT